MNEYEGKKVRVRLRVGDADVEVECDVGEVGDVVERVLKAVAGSSIVSDKGKSTRESLVRRGETCKGLILDLWSEGWFGLGRALGDVHAEMGRRGFHYDRTAVAHALVDLVREGILTREGRPRRYRYVQKRPPLDTGNFKELT
ncbi:MAG: hypothetical protein JSV05_07580 [Candidatus Bathyarchaeota archaeon]|nr:MAG: hypothetical protein JSV05_07580 [Candidatus Bathyarchaeota archaeon]